MKAITEPKCICEFDGCGGIAPDWHHDYCPCSPNYKSPLPPSQPAATPAYKAAEAIVKELSGRKGFDDLWHDLDDEIQAEIISAFAVTITKVTDCDAIAKALAEQFEGNRTVALTMGGMKEGEHFREFCKRVARERDEAIAECSRLAEQRNEFQLANAQLQLAMPPPTIVIKQPTIS